MLAVSNEGPLNAPFTTPFFALIVAVAHARMGDKQAAQTAYDAAIASWPADLKSPGDIRTSAPAGVLWFESAHELIALRDESLALMNADAG